MNRILLFCATVSICLFGFTPKARAVVYNVTANTNWSALAPTPTSADTIVVKNGSNLTVNVAAAVINIISLGGAAPNAGNGTLTFNNGTQLTMSGTLTLGGAATRTGTLTMTAGGTLILPSITLGAGAYAFNPGTSATQGIIRFTATNTLPNNAVFATFNTVQVQGTGITVTCSRNLTFNNNLTITTGTFTTSVSNYSLTINGGVTNAGTFNANGSTIGVKKDWVNNGTFTGGTSTVTINGSTAQRISGTSSTSFYNLTLSPTAAVVDSLAQNISVTGNMNITAGTFSTTPLNYTVTVTGNLTNGSTLNVYGSAINIGGNFTQNGTFNYGTSTVTFTGAGAHSISGTALAPINFNRITTTGSGTVTLGKEILLNSHLTINSGTGFNTSATNFALTVYGNLYIGGTLTLNGSALGLRGNFTHATGGTFNANTSTVTFNGTSQQSFDGNLSSTFNNALLNNSSGILLASTVNMTVNTTLTLTSGNISTNLNKVIIPSSGTVSRVSGHIVGNLQKNIATGIGVIKPYEVGSSTTYRPVNSTFGVVTAAGDMTVSNTAGDHPSICSGGTVANIIEPGLSTNTYWTIDTSGASFNYSNLSLTFNYVAGDLDASTTPTSFVVKKYSASVWSSTTAGTMTGTSAQATGVTGEGAFVAGQAFQVPVITADPPANQAICVGSNVNFSVAATPIPPYPITYQWQKNGSNIAGATSALYSIASVIAANAGVYRCIVKSGCPAIGADTSGTSTLVVNSPPAIVVQPVQQIVCINSNAVFSVVASGAGLTYQWRKENFDLSDGGSLSGTSTSTLTVTNATYLDTSLTYHVRITGSCSPAVISDSVKLEIKQPVAIVTEPTAQTIGLGANFNLIVTATGDDQAFQWQKNNVNLVNGGGISGATNDTLTVATAAYADTGFYRCIVYSNPATCSFQDTTTNVFIDVVNFLVFLGGDWNVASNWSPAQIPTNADSCLIPVGVSCVIPTGYNAECLSLTLEGDLTIQSSATLTGSGMFTSQTGSITSVEEDFPAFSNYELFGETQYTGPYGQTISSQIYWHLSIQGGDSKTLGGTVTVRGDLFIDSASTLVAGSDTMFCFGDWTNNGTFDYGVGQVEFNSTTDTQRIMGSSVTGFFTLQANNTSPGGLIMESDCDLYGHMKLDEGGAKFTVDSGVVFTFKSYADWTAQLHDVPVDATWNGKIKMEVFIDNTVPTGWHMVLPCLHGTGTEMVRYLEPYNGNLHLGYLPTDANPLPLPLSNDSLEGGWDSTSVSFSYTGTPHMWDQTFVTSYTVTPFGTANGSYHDGWNLVGNPYPAVIDWDWAGGMTRQDMFETFWIWNHRTDDYEYWEYNVGGTRDLQNYIPVSQGFWIHVKSASTNFTMNESAKRVTNGSLTKNPGVALKSTEPYFILRITDPSTNLSDRCYIRFADGCDDLFDDKDVMRLYSGTSKKPNIASLLPDNMALGINSMAPFSGPQVFPIQVKIIYTGDHTIDWPLISTTIPGSACIWLKDLVTGDSVNMLTTSSYTFFSTQTNQTNLQRFQVIFFPPADFETTLASCPGTPDGSATVTGTGDAPWDYLWKDEGGNIIQHHTNVSGPDALTGFPAGSYTVEITNGGGTYCNVVTQAIEIKGLPEANANAVVTNVSCNDAADGAILVNPSGAEPLTYQWSGGSTASNLTGLTAGTYTLHVIDNNNCLQEIPITVGYDLHVISGFTPSEDTVMVGMGGAVTFFNGSTGANQYIWNFGDGSPDYMTSASGPITHFYNVNSPGVFEASLEAENSGCDDISNQNIVVMVSTTIISKENKKLIDVYSSKDKVFVKFLNEEPARIKVYNSLGALMLAREVSESETILDMSFEAAGVYYVSVEQGGHSIEQKVSLTK